MRVAFKDAAVHESAGIAFIGVAYDVLLISGGLPRKPPLRSRRESRPAAPPQPCALDLSDNLLGGLAGKHGAQGRIAPPGNVVVDLRRIDLAVVRENDPLLLAVKRDLVIVDAFQPGCGVRIEEAVDDFAVDERFPDNLGHIVDGELLIEDLRWQDDCYGSPLAKAVAARLLDLNRRFEALFFDLVEKSFTYGVGAPRTAAGSAADRNACLVGISAPQDAGAIGIEVFDSLQTVLGQHFLPP